MRILYRDQRIVVAVKPAGVVSTDQPGGLPELVRRHLGLTDVRTVHRLDQAVSGLMVLALDHAAASELSRQLRLEDFGKEYMAVIHGSPSLPQGRLEDLLWRDKRRRMTFVADAPGKDVQQALLDYRVLESREEMSLVRIQLITGRTHQIRVQFASRGHALVGERKYAVQDDPCALALWSCRLRLRHPESQKPMEFFLPPPSAAPWDRFSEVHYGP